MTEHIGGIPARGAIDLSRLTQAATAPSSAPSSGGGVEVVDVTEASFQSFAEQSLHRPVFLLLGSREGAPSDVTVYTPEAPLGAAINGRSKGDTVSFTGPTGKEMRVVILDATPYVA